MTLADKLTDAYNKLYSLAKVAVTVRHFTGVTRDSEDDVSESYTDTNAYAVVQIMGYEDEAVVAGQLDAGDVIAFFPSGVTIEENDQVYYDNQWFVEKRITEEKVGSTTIFKEVLLKRT